MPRILVAGLFHETHTFLEGTTCRADFQVLRGAEMLACEGDSSPLGGVLECARDFDWEILAAVDYRAQPSALVEDAVIESFWAELEHAVRQALSTGLDGIYLVLHGAMVSQSYLDVEGEVLERLRALSGAAEVPIFGVFDLHANFTQKMARLANCLVAYRENPHTDGREMAQYAAHLLQLSLLSGQVPRMIWRRPGIVWPPTGTATAAAPMKTLETQARLLEEQPGICAANVVAGFSFADTPDTGVSFVLAGTGSDRELEEGLDCLCALAESVHAQGLVVDPPVDEVLATLLPLPPGLTVLVEPSDNIGGGAPGDGTGLLRALLRHGFTHAAVAINDPEAVRTLQARSPGDRISLSIGGKGSRLDAGPLELEVELVSKRSGRFELEDKQSHLASMCGDVFDMGDCALVRHAGVTLLLSSVKTPPFDLGQWRSQGIEPTELSVIGVKAAVAHRRAYDGIAARMLWVDTPGPCSSNLAQFPYQHLKLDREKLSP
ncbi:MAG: family peptidase [Verrucomicrobiaceae bacterium]|nr:family peptidase [Verrucomicrobiaceae bacterium]